MPSLSGEKSNGSELWPLTTTKNNPLICTTDDHDMNSSDIEQKSKDKKQQKKNKILDIESDVLVDRFRLTQKKNRENFDAFQYSSDDEGQPQPSYSPNHVWHEEEEEEEDF